MTNEKEAHYTEDLEHTPTYNDAVEYTKEDE